MLVNVSAGTGVHAYYRHHSGFRVRPWEMPESDVKSVLDSLSDRKSLPPITSKLIRDIQHCWQFLDDFRTAADACSFEVQLGTPAAIASGPDIYAKHGAEYFVVETKVVHTLMQNRKADMGRLRKGLLPADAIFHASTRRRIPSDIPVRACHGRKQVRAGINHLKQQTHCTKPIYGFVLVFLFFPDNLPWPIWKPVSTFIPPTPLA
jgi:hypothetical protein